MVDTSELESFREKIYYLRRSGHTNTEQQELPFSKADDTARPPTVGLWEQHSAWLDGKVDLGEHTGS